MRAERDSQVYLIGFTGKMGSGKTTAVEVILARGEGRREHFSAECLKFAGPIYRMVKGIYQVAGLPIEKNKARPLMQYLGTDFFRKTYGENFWVELWEKEYHKLIAETHPDNFPLIILCDDVRFENEAALIRKLGGSLIEVYSDPDLRAQRGRDLSNEGHASEAGVPAQYLTGTIFNNAALGSFKDRVNKVFSEIVSTKK